MPTVLVPLADGFEEIEAFAPVDLLRRAGVDVTVASLNDNRHATGRSGITAHADAALSAVAGQAFDLVFLPGGAGVKLLRADPRVGEIVRAQHAAGRWLDVATIPGDSPYISGRLRIAQNPVAGRRSCPSSKGRTRAESRSCSRGLEADPS